MCRANERWVLRQAAGQRIGVWAEFFWERVTCVYAGWVWQAMAALMENLVGRRASMRVTGANERTDREGETAVESADE